MSALPDWAIVAVALCSACTCLCVLALTIVWCVGEAGAYDTDEGEDELIYAAPSAAV